MAWRVAESLEVLLRQLNAAYPKRSKLSDGSIGNAAHSTRTSDHNAWIQDGGVGVVSARDFTHDPANGMDCERLYQALVASRDPRIKYVIWARTITSGAYDSAPWQRRPYSGSNPHDKHLHLSVRQEKSRYDSPAPWAVATPNDEDGIMAAADDIKAMLQDITNRIGGLQYATFPDSGPGGSAGEVLKRVRSIDATVAALAARDPKVTISAAEIAAAIPAELAEQVVARLAEKLAARPAS